MDPDAEFYEFLMKTKENLARLDPKCHEPIVSSSAPKIKNADESDELETFLSKVKITSSATLRKEEKSKELSRTKNHTIEKKPKPLREANEDFSVCSKPGIKPDIESFNLREAEGEAEHNFMAKRKIYGQQLYHFFNKTVFNSRLPENMPLEWNAYLQSTAGKTRCKRKDGQYSCCIELSSEVLISFVRLRDTLLHEMCHAACWLVNHSSDNHGPLWKTWASRCSLILPEIEVPARCHSYDLEYTYILKCVSCDWIRKRFKMCPKLKRNTCPKCGKATTLKTS